jgi:endonuclease/exonuclease/phosphatase family metal-dependent hydrolase
VTGNYVVGSVDLAQEAQAAEFLAGAGNTPLPIVWVGDFNSDAESTVITGVPSATPTYGSIIASGFSDTWNAKHPTDRGFTCCQATALLNSTSTLTERDDLVLTRGPFRVARASLVGDETDRPAAIRVVAIRSRGSRRDARHSCRLSP